MKKDKMRAIIFDMDGVITLTTQLQSQAESKVLSEIGINISPKEIVRTYSGWRDIDVIKDILKKHKVVTDINKLRNKKWNLIKQDIAKDNKITPVPGVINFIQKTHRVGFKLAVASASPRIFINLVLKTLKIKDKFEVISSGDDVLAGKPDPEIFLLTAQKLNTPVNKCVVIEDAKNGLLAAKRAGMKCVAITTTHTRKDLQGADLIIDTFDELTVNHIKSI